MASDVVSPDVGNLDSSAQEADFLPPAEFVSRAIPLLKEYTEKLNGVVQKLERLRSLSSEEIRNRLRALDTEFEIQRDYFQRILSGATQLSRMASQHIEHAKLDEISRIELWLRLAEFEHALRSVQKNIAMGPPR